MKSPGKFKLPETSLSVITSLHTHYVSVFLLRLTKNILEKAFKASRLALKSQVLRKASIHLSVQDNANNVHSKSLYNEEQVF